MDKTDIARLSPQDKEAFHRAAEARMQPAKIADPHSGKPKDVLLLAKSDRLRALVQIVRDGGENNLHYHTTSASFWMVLKGRVRFYGPDDVLIGEFGPHEGTITPRYSRYWFENVGDEDLEILQVSAFSEGARSSGRTDVSEQRFKIDTAEHFTATTAKAG